jgi:hypothetical protein
LPVGITQIPELAQRQEVALDVFDPRFHSALFLWLPGWAGIDFEAVALGTLGIGSLDLGIPETGPGDGAFGVIDVMCPRPLCAAELRRSRAG